MYCRWLEHYSFGFDDVLFGTISWRRTHESLRVAFSMSHPVSPLLSLFGRPFLSVVFWFCLFWVVFVFVLVLMAPHVVEIS